MLAEIEDRDAIYDAIKQFLGKGKSMNRQDAEARRATEATKGTTKGTRNTEGYMDPGGERVEPQAHRREGSPVHDFAGSTEQPLGEPAGCDVQEISSAFLAGGTTHPTSYDSAAAEAQVRHRVMEPS